MRTRTTAITAVSLGAALCVGTSVPAIALDSTTPTPTSTNGSTITLAQLQSFVDSAVAARLARLDEIATNTAADPNLSDSQKAAIADWIAKQRAALTTLKSDVDGATTLDQARQALATDGATFGWFEWGDRDEHPSVGTTEAKDADADTDADRANRAADEKPGDDQGDSQNTPTSVRPAESSDEARARTVSVSRRSESSGRTFSDSSQPSEHHSEGRDQSRSDHSSGDHSSGDQGSGDHSGGDQGGGDHSRGDHSGGDHSDSGQ